jgi:hypothetical protein
VWHFPHLNKQTRVFPRAVDGLSDDSVSSVVAVAHEVNGT